MATQIRIAIACLALALVLLFVAGVCVNYELYSEISYIRTGDCRVSGRFDFDFGCAHSGSECYTGLMRYEIIIDHTKYEAAQLYSRDQLECKINTTIHCEWDARYPSTVSSNYKMKWLSIELFVFNIAFVAIEGFVTWLLFLSYNRYRIKIQL
jgi:hypothetical protein